MSYLNDPLSFLVSFESSKFKKLRPAQQELLENYASDYSLKSDVAIELPTGGGKTLVALLIGEDWRQKGKKVAILSGNKTLARQMLLEAQQLGIPCVLFEGKGELIPVADKRAYGRAEKIAIMNYWVYINQKPSIDPADILIIDDAHLAENCLQNLYSVEIKRHEDNELFLQIAQELRINFSGYSIIDDALDDNTNPTTPPEVISFLDQNAFSNRLLEIVEASELYKTSDFSYRWNRLRHKLNDTTWYMGHDILWIKPDIFPFSANSYYSSATQRIYMSATIGQPSDLSRRLGVNHIEVIPLKDHEQGNGRRFIILNKDESKNMSARMQLALAAALKTSPKCVWMCASNSDAEKLEELLTKWLEERSFSHPIWVLTSQGDEIENFKSSPSGHLIVAGRFDGMDFEGDECRLVVFLTLPRAINLQEEFATAYLRDATFLKQRLNHRIIQGLGRCNRAKDDYAIYILADRRFVTHFGKQGERKGIPPKINAEIDFAEDNLEVDDDTLCQKIDKFLSGDFSDYDNELANLSVAPIALEAPVFTSEIVNKEVVGWTSLFESQAYNISANKFYGSWVFCEGNNILEYGAYVGYLRAKALYLEGQQGSAASKEQALEQLRAAIARGNNAAWFNRLKSSINRMESKQESDPTPTFNAAYKYEMIRSFDMLLEQVGSRGSRFDKYCNRVSEQLNSGKHDEFTEGLKTLGVLLGFSSYRPKHNGATDCIWRLGFGDIRQVYTLEAKIEHKPSGKIDGSDVGQVHKQVARAQGEYKDQGYSIQGLIVSHLTQLDPIAASSMGTVKIIENPAVLSLWGYVRTLLTLYREHWDLDNQSIRQQAVNKISHYIPSGNWLGRTIESSDTFISIDAITREWQLEINATVS